MNLIEAGLIKEVPPHFTRIISPFRLYRYDAGEHRYYMTVDQEGRIIDHFLSVTAFTHLSLATSPHLINWIKGLGAAADTVRDERAGYGTALHICIAESLLKKRVNFDEIRLFAAEQAVASGFADQSARWSYDMTMDVMSFYQFYKDHIIEVVAMEFPIYSKKWGVAGTIDLVARVKSGRKVVNAIVDFKSGRKGFWEAHELQLHVYNVCWNEHFGGEFPVTHLFNWAPKAWRGKIPTYSFSNQTGSAYAGTVLSRLRVAKNEGWSKPPGDKLYIQGEFDIRDFVPERHITVIHTAAQAQTYMDLDPEQVIN